MCSEKEKRKKKNLPDYSIQQKIKNVEDDNTARLRTRLMGIEGHFSDTYFSQILTLVPNSIRPETRKTWKAFDGFNNILNLCYEVLSWKVHHALIRAKLEPYLGFLHSLAEGKPSLICDFMELYRYLIDDFVIQYCKKLKKRDFIMKYENFSSNRKGKREYLNDALTHDLMRSLNGYFTTKVDISRIRMGNNQEIETLINEEALLFAMYLRNEKQTWTPRISFLIFQFA
jgi:CRISPR-associated protein Cas1